MAISFSAGQAYDFTCDTVNFSAMSCDRRILCRISREALQDHFGARSAELTDAFSANRSAIELKAEELINGNRFETDGTILIRTADF